MNKTILFITLFLLFSINAIAQETTSSEVNRTILNKGVGLGSVIAVVLSWQRNKSILWAIFHGVISWLYVIHFAMTRRDGETSR